MNTNIDRLDFPAPCTIGQGCKASANRVVTFNHHSCTGSHAFTTCNEHWLGWLLWFDRQRAIGQPVSITDIEHIGLPDGAVS